MQTQIKTTQEFLSPSNHINKLSNIQTSYQTQKKLKNLFYIKSKHTKKYFNNHPYFGATQETKQRLKTEQCYQSYTNRTQNNGFVKMPTQYGLYNTFKYMQEKSFLGNKNKEKMESESNLMGSKQKSNGLLDKRRRMSLKYSKINDQNEDNQNDNHNYMKATAAYESRFYNTVNERRLKTQSLVDTERQKDSTIRLQQQKYRNPFEKFRQRRVSLSISKQPQLQQSKITTSPTRSNAIYNTRRPSLNINNLPSRHEVKFLYGKRLKSMQQIPYRYVTLDLFPFIISTFIKCKIHYKDMSQYYFEFVMNAIKKVLKQNKKPEKYDIKDIINLSTIKGLIQFLQQYKENDYQWTQTIRYFFLLSEQKVLDYHLNVIKESVANMIAIKFDVEFGQRELFVFDLDTKKEVTQLYDLLKGERFLIGDDPKVMIEYSAMENSETEKKSMQDKIQKWKSLAECETVTSMQNKEHDRNHPHTQSLKSPQQSRILPFGQTRKLSSEKFNLIFDQFKLRQQKRTPKHSAIGESRTVSHKSREMFVERSRLKKEQEFFQ